MHVPFFLKESWSSNVQTYVIDPGASNSALVSCSRILHATGTCYACTSFCLVDKLRLQSIATNKIKNHLSPKRENVSIMKM